MLFVDQEERFPSETDARSAFAAMSHAAEPPADWLLSYASSCPESYLRDKTIGYVFVAGGLSTKVAADHWALVFFCPADSHQRSEQHCHAVVGRGELVRLRSNTEMIELLRREIARAKDGSVPYSIKAISKMERELKAREERARMREPKTMQATAATPCS